MPRRGECGGREWNRFDCDLSDCLPAQKPLNVLKKKKSCSNSVRVSEGL